MFLGHKLAQFKAYQNGVKHCTFNPDGPGVVRIHLVPPRFSLCKSRAYIVILNGYYVLPIGYAWALILSHFMDEVNRFDGKPITQADEAAIIRNTVTRTHKIYPTTSKDIIEEDLSEILHVLFAVAHGNTPHVAIEKLSIRAYADNMTAPHRMDLMVSAMSTDDGSWHCNQHCLFCYAAGQHKSDVTELDTASWKAVIDRLEKAHIPMVTFTGGEPTMRDDLEVLISYAERMVTRLNTNGIRLTPDLTHKLKTAGLDSVQVTLYSHDEAIHNKLVGGNHFKDTVRGIQNAVNEGLDISINTPLCRLNSDYEQTLRFIQSLSACALSRQAD